MKKLLLLHERHTPDDSDIWRVAIRSGWNTERTNMYKVKDHIEGYDYVRYYGNTLHARFLLSANKLPFTFSPIDYSILPGLGEFTKRHIAYYNFSRLVQPIQTTMFIKPARDKWFEAKVYKPGDVIVGAPEDGDEIYYSEVVKFLDEVRCYVLDGEILTSSYYRMDTQVWDATGLPPDMINFDKKLADSPLPAMVREIYARGGLPRGVVIDFGRTENGEWSLVEFNEAWASGLYYCDPYKCLEVIEASQE